VAVDLKHSMKRQLKDLADLGIIMGNEERVKETLTTTSSVVP